jgi:hypothetical protein
MTSPAFEAFLAKIYTDPEARTQFLAGPLAAAQRSGLTQSECDALARIDRTGLEMTAASLARKRHKSHRSPNLGTQVP